MKIVFDMDNTLFDEFGREARPGVMKLLARLRADGHELVLWTSSTRDRARRILADHDAARFFSSFLYREDYDPENQGLPKDIDRIGADALIDDDPKHVELTNKRGGIGIRISTYRGGGAVPGELKAIYRTLSRRKGFLARIRGALR